MNILHLHPGPDTGGKSMAAKKALEEAGDKVRVFVGPLSGADRFYFQYPAAELWDQAEVEAAYEWADVVVLHNEPALLMTRFRQSGDKPLIVHHHGSILRKGGYAKWTEGDRLGAVQVVSSIDLLIGLPDSVGWLPQIVDIARMAEIRAEEYGPSPHFRVSHAPTSRQAKGTRVIVASVRKLRGQVEWEMIQRRPWAECLRRKARTDLYVDQLTYGFGANAVEAWGMSMPVFGSASGDILERMRAEWGTLPFYDCGQTRESVMAALRLFAADRDLSAGWAARGLAHARKYHDQSPFVTTFRGYAGQAMGGAATLLHVESRAVA